MRDRGARWWTSASSTRDDREVAPGELGEIVTRSDCVMSGYWNNPRGERRRAARRVAAHRRSRQHGRARLPDAQGSREGHGDLRRVEHLSARDRGGPAPARGRCSKSRSSVVRIRTGVRSGRVRRAASGCRDQRRRARPPVPRRHRPLQAAAHVLLRRQPAEEQLREGAEDRAARAPGGGHSGRASYAGAFFFATMTSRSLPLRLSVTGGLLSSPTSTFGSACCARNFRSALEAACHAACRSPHRPPAAAPGGAVSFARSGTGGRARPLRRSS